jgi:hypothetical protein
MVIFYEVPSLRNAFRLESLRIKKASFHLPWRLRQQVLPKRYYLPTKIYGATYQNTAVSKL